MIINNSDWPNISQNIKIIIFDMDGTLYSSEEILHHAYIQAVQDFNKETNKNISTPTLDEILHQVGQPAYKIFAALFPQLTEAERTQLNSYSLNNLCQMIRQQGGKIYPEVASVLQSLTDKGLKLYIASNGRRAYLQSILAGFQLESFFQPLLTIEDAGISTKAEIIQTYSTQANLSPEQVLMVGDRTSDIDAANQANVYFCGVTWGHGPTDEVKDADVIAEETIELLRLFK